jgi:hypothetical protein
MRKYPPNRRPGKRSTGTIPETDRQQLNGCSEFVTALDEFLDINPPGNPAMMMAVEAATMATKATMKSTLEGNPNDTASPD